MHPTTSTTRLCLRIQPWFMPSCCTLTFREFVLKLPSAGQLMQSCHQRAQWELVLELPSAGQLMQSYNIFFAFSCYILSLLFFSTVCFRFLLLKAVCRLQHDSVLYATRHWWTSLVFRGFELGLKLVYLPFHSQANLLLPSNKHLLTNAQDRCMQEVLFMRLRYMWHIFNDKTQAFCKQLTINGTLFL